jgi:hypothetical protein
MASRRRSRPSADRRAQVSAGLGPPPIGPAVVRAGLGQPVPTPPVAAEAEWQAWLAVAAEQRLASMTLSAVRAGLQAPPDVLGALTAAAIDEVTVSLAAGHAAVEMVELLQGHDLDPVLLKGTTIADRYYPHPEDRPTRDVDLLLPADQLVDAWNVLAGQGFHLPAHGMDARWVRRYAKGRTLIRPDGMELDLHRTLTVLPFGLLVDLDQLEDHVDQVVLAGRAVPTLTAEATFFHCCLHAALMGEPSVLAHLDIVVTARAGLDLDRVRALVGDGPLTSVVRAAVVEAGALAPVDPAVASFAASLPHSGRGDRLLDWHRRRHRSFGATVVRSRSFVGGPAEQIKYGAAVGVGVTRMLLGRDGQERRPPR